MVRKPRASASPRTLSARGGGWLRRVTGGLGLPDSPRREPGRSFAATPTTANRGRPPASRKQTPRRPGRRGPGPRRRGLRHRGRDHHPHGCGPCKAERRAAVGRPGQAQPNSGSGPLRRRSSAPPSSSRHDNVTDWAAALTYYGVLSIFPGALVLVSLLGFLGPNGRDTVEHTINDRSATTRSRNWSPPSSTRSPTRAPPASPRSSVSSLAFWSASGYVAAFMRASNAVYDVPEGRPVWKTLPIRVGVTAVIGVMLVASALIVVFTGNLAKVVGEHLHIGGVAVHRGASPSGRCCMILISLMFAILYWASPNAKTGGFRWVSPGGIFAVVLWLARLRRVRDLPRQLRQLQQDVRHPGRRHRLPGLAVDLQHRHPAGRGAGRRAGTRPGHRGRPRPRRRAVPRAARRPQAQEGHRTGPPSGLTIPSPA